MITTYHCGSSRTIDESDMHMSPNAPWMPLDGLIEGWATLSKKATTAAATKTISQAFAALTEERTALRHYTLACKEQRRRSLTTISWVEALHEQECAIDALTQAASFWLEAASSLEHCLTEADDPQEEMNQQEIRALISYALEQRMRVWTIAAHLVHEHLIWYRLSYADEMQGCDPMRKAEGQR
jgi:hypothetical protein